MVKSSLLSLASRIFSTHGKHVWRGLHTSRNTASLAIETKTMMDDDHLDEKSTVYSDIDTDDALEHQDYFGVQNLFTVRQLFDARVHYGHKETALHDGMRQFVFGIRAEQVIFDLDITAYHLRKALNFAGHVALRGGVILFVSRNPQNSYTIEETAKLCREYAHTRKWYGSELTNADLYYGAVTRVPELVIFLSTLSELRKQHSAVADAAKMNIPTIGIVDSNCCPNLISYPVPGNDDSIPAVELYCNLFKQVILQAKAERERRFIALKQALEEEQKQQNNTSIEKDAESENHEATDVPKHVAATGMKFIQNSYGSTKNSTRKVAESLDFEPLNKNQRSHRGKGFFDSRGRNFNKTTSSTGGDAKGFESTNEERKK